MSSDFKKFWVGQTISNLGSSFTQWAVPLLVYQLTHSAVSLGIATAATFLPYLLFGLIIGAWMDRVDRKQAMIALDWLNALVILSIPVVAEFGHLTVWWIYGVTFIQSTIFIAFSSGEFAAIPSLVSTDDLPMLLDRIVHRSAHTVRAPCHVPRSRHSGRQARAVWRRVEARSTWSFKLQLTT